MGRKVNPHGLRVGVIKDWDSRWYAEADFADCLVEDYDIRKFLKNRLKNSGVSKDVYKRQDDGNVSCGGSSVGWYSQSDSVGRRLGGSRGKLGLL